MDHQLCAHCGASLPRTGTYCLACDTPVADTTSRLSVGETQVVAHGRPLVGVALVVVVLLLVGGGAWAVTTLSRRHADRGVSAPAVKGTDIVVSAESGKTGGCPYLKTWTAGDPKTQEAACLALGGVDPGVHLRGLHPTAVHRHGTHATVTLAATQVDRGGKRPWTRTLPMVQEDDGWVLDWDGSALAPAA